MDKILYKRGKCQIEGKGAVILIFAYLDTFLNLIIKFFIVKMVISTLLN
jgi:hypothetical protein